MKRPIVHHFTAPLERQPGRYGWSYVEFPHDVPELFGTRGEVRVKCMINGIAVDRALMPTRSGVHIISLSADLRRKAGILHSGEQVQVALWLDPEPRRITLPPELADTLDFMPTVKATWEQQTPGLRRSMCLWVDTGKTLATRAKRVAEVIKRLEAGTLRWPSSRP